MIDSQRAADLYNSGAKLWTKESLKAIELELEQSKFTEKFSIRCIGGDMLQIKNPGTHWHRQSDQNRVFWSLGHDSIPRG